MSVSLAGFVVSISHLTIQIQRWIHTVGKRCSQGDVPNLIERILRHGINAQEPEEVITNHLCLQDSGQLAIFKETTDWNNYRRPIIDAPSYFSEFANTSSRRRNTASAYVDLVHEVVLTATHRRIYKALKNLGLS